MPPHIDILGEPFAPVTLTEALRHSAPCVYLMAREQGGAHDILYAGQTHNLGTRFATHHRIAEAVAMGATHALILVIRDARLRLDFETMLRWSLRPPMNAEDVPTHMQAWRAAMACGKHDVAEQARAAHMKRTAQVLAPHAALPPRAGRG